MFLPTDPNIYLTPIALITLVAALFQIRQNSKDLKKKKKELDQKVYETLVYRQVSERIGYELDVSKILDTIIDSLNKLLPFSVASYILINQDHTTLSQRMQLEEPVPKKFLDTTTKFMLESLAEVVSGKKFGPEEIAQTTSGAITDDTIIAEPKSLWVTPVLINNRGVGVLSIVSKNPGLYKKSEMEFLGQILSQANRALNNLEAIISSERGKLESMVSSMADGVLMFDVNHNLILINPAAANLLDLPSETKPTIFDIARVLSDKLDLRSKLDEAIKENRLVSFDDLTVGGKISQLLISQVKDDKQRLLGTVVLFHDRTAEKQLQTLREDFTAMMVHELRAPLSVVSGTADMLIKDPELADTPQGKELIVTTKSSVSSMLSLVNDLLDVAKLEAGKFQILKTKSDISEVIKEKVEFFNQMAKSKSLTLSDELDGELVFNFDKDRISQVLNNLISNSIKFTPPGGSILVRAYKVNTGDDIKWQFSDSKMHTAKIPIAGPSVLVSVTDTGQGIDEVKMSELFSKFKQLHRVEAGPGGVFGTGLGLIIAKGIVESHGGKMFVESHVNEGTTFFFVLPLDN